MQLVITPKPTMQQVMAPMLALQLTFEPLLVDSFIALSVASMKTVFIHHLWSPCSIFEGTNYITWSTNFRPFLQIHGPLPFITDESPLSGDLSHLVWFVSDLGITT